MTYKIANALRLISILVLVVVFFIFYAGLPEQVLVLIDELGNPTHYFPRDSFFYGTLASIILANTLLYMLSILLSKSPQQSLQASASFMMLLAVVVNVFFGVSLTFLGILNGQENFDYSSFSPFFYLSGGLFVIWIFSFLVSILRSKK